MTENLSKKELYQKQKEEKVSQKQKQKEKDLRKKKFEKYFKIGILLLALFVFLFSYFSWSKNDNLDTKKPKLTTSEILKARSDDYTKGTKEPKAVVIEYLDFECEACGAYYPLVKKLSEEFKDDVLFVTRYFPLPGHRNGMSSALAVEAAAQQGKFWQMHDLLFEKQSQWGERRKAEPELFEKYAETLGLDMKRFKEDVKSSEVKDRVLRDKNEALQIGVNYTPTFYLNGEKIRNPRGYEEFRALLQKAVSESESQSGNEVKNQKAE